MRRSPKKSSLKSTWIQKGYSLRSEPLTSSTKPQFLEPLSSSQSDTQLQSSVQSLIPLSSSQSDTQLQSSVQSLIPLSSSQSDTQLQSSVQSLIPLSSSQSDTQLQSSVQSLIPLSSSQSDTQLQSPIRSFVQSSSQSQVNAKQTIGISPKKASPKQRWIPKSQFGDSPESLNRSSSASTQLQSLSQLSPTRLHAYPQDYVTKRDFEDFVNEMRQAIDAIQAKLGWIYESSVMTYIFQIVPRLWDITPQEPGTFRQYHRLGNEKLFEMFDNALSRRPQLQKLAHFFGVKRNFTFVEQLEINFLMPCWSNQGSKQKPFKLSPTKLTKDGNQSNVVVIGEMTISRLSFDLSDKVVSRNLLDKLIQLEFNIQFIVLKYGITVDQVRAFLCSPYLRQQRIDLNKVFETKFRQKALKYLFHLYQSGNFDLWGI